MGISKVQRRNLKCIGEKWVAVCVKSDRSFEIWSDPYIEKLAQNERKWRCKRDTVRF